MQTLMALCAVLYARFGIVLLPLGLARRGFRALRDIS